MLLLIPKPPQNINEGMLGICCKDPGVEEFGIYWICGCTSHSCNSGTKYELPAVQKIPNSQKVSFPFKKESWFGGLIWILRKKQRKEGERREMPQMRMIQIFHSRFLKTCFKVNLK